MNVKPSAKDGPFSFVTFKVIKVAAHLWKTLCYCWLDFYLKWIISKYFFLVADNLILRKFFHFHFLKFPPAVTHSTQQAALQATTIDFWTLWKIDEEENPEAWQSSVSTRPVRGHVSVLKPLSFHMLYENVND